MVNEYFLSEINGRRIASRRFLSEHIIPLMPGETVDLLNEKDAKIESLKNQIISMEESDFDLTMAMVEISRKAKLLRKCKKIIISVNYGYNELIEEISKEFEE